jgi:hypothetical protein
MSAVSHAAQYSRHEGGAEKPFQSDNPVYSDTWGVATVDPDSNQAFWAQVLHNGSTGIARHLLMVISNGKTSCDYAYTAPGDPFHSELMDVELDGWNSYRVTSKTKSLELTSISGHDPVDFGRLLTFKDFSLGHQEAGARTTGQINGIPFNGVGLRDRSFGPRPMGGVGSVNSVVLVSQDLSVSFAANLVHGGQTPIGNAPDTKFAFVSTPDGAWSTSDPAEIGVRRSSDGMAVGLRIRDEELTITKEIGHHHYTPHWYPSLDLRVGERRILHHVLRFVEGQHPRYGRVAGLIDMGTLVPC